jgi:hypothetical protein
MGKRNARKLEKIKKGYVLSMVEGKNWEMGQKR